MKKHKLKIVIITTMTNNKTVIALAIVGAFVAGTITTGTIAYAADHRDAPFGQPFDDIWVAIESLQTQIDEILDNLNDDLRDIDQRIDNIELIPGPQGPPGIDGTSCSVIDTETGAKINCTDGTVATINDGQEGTPGTIINVIQFNSGRSAAVTTVDYYFNNGEIRAPVSTGLRGFHTSASMVGIDGIITEFRYKIGESNSPGETITATLYKNNLPTNFSCSVVSGTTTSCISIDSLVVSAGDLLAVADVTDAGYNVDVQNRYATVVISSAIP